MKVILTLVATLFFVASPAWAQYYPGQDWEEKKPEDFKIQSSALEKAVDFAMNNEYSGSRDLRQAILKGFEREPFHEIKGPTKRRGGPAGLILKDGYIIASWGEVDRVDMTFSVTKSYLSTVAGLAVEEGLISSTADLVTRKHSPS